MSRKTVLIFLILALALGAAALLLKRPGPPLAVGPLLSFRPSEAAHLRVERRGGVEVARRTGDEWTIARHAPGEDATTAWPASLTPVRAALRILSSLEPLADAESGAKPDADSALVEIGLDDETRRVFRLGSRPLAGRVLLEVVQPGADRRELEGRVFWVEADIARVLIDTGLLAWRERAAFPGIGPDTARVTMTGDSGRLALARVAGRWALREPVAAPADEQKVRALLGALAAIQVKDFGDRGFPESAGASPPLGEIIIEADQREPEGESFRTRTVTRRIEFARIAGLAGDQILVRVSPTTRTRRADGTVEERASGTHTFTVSAPDTSPMIGASEAYLAPRAAVTPAPDVGQVVIRRGEQSRTFGRTIDGWAERRPDGTSVPLSPIDVSGVQALLTLLCEKPAEHASLAASTESPTLWEIELRSLGGEPLDSMTMTLPPDGGVAGGVVVHTQPVWRTYASTDSAAALTWLSGLTP